MNVDMCMLFREFTTRPTPLIIPAFIHWLSGRVLNLRSSSIIALKFVEFTMPKTERLSILSFAAGTYCEKN